MDKKTFEILEGLKKKSNLDLIEHIRMNSNMMQFKF